MTAESALVHTAALLLDARIGLKPDPSFRSRLARALREVADARNIDGESLVGALAGDASLLDQLLDRVTVQETAFFRHPEQFETLARTLLPPIDVPLRAWSAACANGQEAYSLAMLVREAGRSGSVLASDVSPAALHRTGAGYYHEREMRGVSAARRREHFDVVDGGWQTNQSLRDMVNVERHNLLDPIPPQVAECHVVMCRNVLIYFTQRHAELFLERLADVMDPGAYLFIGGAETVWHVTDRFEPIQTGACFAYRPRKHRAGSRPLVALTAVPVVKATRKPAPSTIVVTPHSTSSSASKVGGPQVAEQSQLPIDAAADDHERIGGQLLAGGSVREAIVTFRQWAYLSPENPAAHLQLALALDRADERPTARRAYRAALTALDRCSPDRLPHVLQGYERSELRRLLVDRSSARSAVPDAVASPTTPPPAHRERPAVRS
jgi:chemotaxis protein methyltransferase CheR